MLRVEWVIIPLKGDRRIDNLGAATARHSLSLCRVVDCKPGLQILFVSWPPKLRTNQLSLRYQPQLNSSEWRRLCIDPVVELLAIRAWLVETSRKAFVSVSRIWDFLIRS